MPDASSRDAPQQTPPRRRFLRRLALAALGTTGAGLLLGGCGSEETAPASPPDSAATASGAPPVNQCVDRSTLSPEARSGRAKYNYVAQSPHAQKQCDNCQFWIADEGNGNYEAPCGGCRLFAGPVHPEGYCNAWLTA